MGSWRAAVARWVGGARGYRLLARRRFRVGMAGTLLVRDGGVLLAGAGVDVSGHGRGWWVRWASVGPRRCSSGARLGVGS